MNRHDACAPHHIIWALCIEGLFGKMLHNQIACPQLVFRFWEIPQQFLDRKSNKVLVCVQYFLVLLTKL